MRFVKAPPPPREIDADADADAEVPIQLSSVGRLVFDVWPVSIFSHRISNDFFHLAPTSPGAQQGWSS